MSKKLMAVLALVMASVAPAPAMAWDGSWNAPLIIGGLLGAAYGQRVIPQQPRIVQQPAQIIMIERQQPQVVIVRETAPTTVVVQADPRIVGTACRSNTHGWTGTWVSLSDRSKACKAF